MTSYTNNSLISEVQGIEFPALPGTTAVTRLSTLFQLEQSQWWSGDEIQQHQLQQAKSVLQHSVKSVPFYKSRLKTLSLNYTISYDQWLNIPILKRDEIQSNNKELITTKLPPSHGKMLKQLTSGSTGKPIETLSTELNSFFWDVFTLRDHIWHKRDFSKPLAVIRYTEDPKANYPNYITADNWGKATQNIYKTANCYVLNIFSSVVDQVKWLKKVKPFYLLSHPSVIKEIANYCLSNDIDLTFISEVRTISEAVPENLQSLCKEAWGADLVDVYSTVELGYIALQCPDYDNYHIQSENLLVEILDDDGNPCKPGEIGRVIVTTLHNFAFPLIRYELGDYAEAGEPCACGRGLPVIKRILGRYRNLVTFPDGTKAWPKFNLGQMTSCAPVLQFQAIQHTLNHVEYLLICKRPLTDNEHHSLIDLFTTNLRDQIQVTITEVKTLSRSKNGKYEEFISYV